MESEQTEGYVGLTKDEIRLIWAVNYFGGELRNLEQCRAFVDGKMREFEGRYPSPRERFVGAVDVVEGKV